MKTQNHNCLRWLSAFLFFVVAVLPLSVVPTTARAADVTVTIPDVEINRVLNAIANTQGYTGLNPQGQAETKAQFARRMVRNWIIAQVKTVEGEAAAQSAKQTANAAVDAIGIN